MSIPRPEKATQRDNLAASLAAFRAKGNDVKVLPETPKGKLYEVGNAKLPVHKVQRVLHEGG